MPGTPPERPGCRHRRAVAHGRPRAAGTARIHRRTRRSRRAHALGGGERVVARAGRARTTLLARAGQAAAGSGPRTRTRLSGSGLSGLAGLSRACRCRAAGLVRPIRTVGSRRLVGPGGRGLLARCPRHRTGARCAGAGSRRTAVGQTRRRDADAAGLPWPLPKGASGAGAGAGSSCSRTARLGGGRGRRARAGGRLDSGRGRGCRGRRFRRGLRSLPGGLLRRRRFARQLLFEPAFHRRFDGRGSRSYELPHVLQHAEDGLAFDSELFRKLVDSDLCHCSPCWRSER